MTDPISLTGLFVALTLPWACGCIWINWLLGRTGRCNAFIVMGQGFFVGLLITTLIIRLWDVVGFDLNFWGIAATISVVGGVGIVLQTVRPSSVVPKRVVETIPAWHIALATVFLVLIAWRHVTLLQELLLRPLFSWDSWMNWAPKAIVWFHHGSLVDFVNNPPQWLHESGDGAYALGNWQANTYPIVVPLIQLWGMLGVGTWDHSTIYLPWVMASVGVGLALYGHLRLAGVPFLMAVIACYMLLNLPYWNVHAVLAGYADIWVASVFFLAVAALYEIRQSRHWAYVVLLIIASLLCVQLKVPGTILAAVLLFFGACEWVNVKLRRRLELAGLGALALSLLLLLNVDVSLNIPYLGTIVLHDGVFDLGRLGRFHLEYHPLGSTFLEAFFVMINWNLLWYLFVFCVFYCVARGDAMRLIGSEFLAVFTALAVLSSIFLFTQYYVTAINFVTLNRALVYSVPAMVFCIFLCFQRRSD